jgi:hypothetical protein
MQPDFSNASWRKSTGSMNGDCVEVASARHSIGVRDSKQCGNGPVLVFTERSWRAFSSRLLQGEFNLGQLPQIKPH